MDKEEQEILEMAKMFCEKLTYASRICVKDCKSSDCLFIDYANVAYKEGYRKADEVRKETAKEILQTISHEKWFNGREVEHARDYVWFKKLCDKYGVEVEE